MLGQGRPTNEIEREINERINRIAELEQGFAEFCGADGGKHSNKRKSKVIKAVKKAKGERKALHEKKKSGGSETILVEGTKIASSASPTKPSAAAAAPLSDLEMMSQAQGPVSIAESGANDYDPGETRIVEIQSGADGISSFTKTNVGHIAVAAIVAAAAIWAIHKYKPFGIGK